MVQPDYVEKLKGFSAIPNQRADSDRRLVIGTEKSLHLDPQTMA